MKRAKRKVKNIILKTITGIAVVMFLLSACAVDSASWIPLIVCLVCMAWLAVFAYVNGAWVTRR